MIGKRIILLLVSLAIFSLVAIQAQASNENKVIAPVISLLLSDTTMQEKIPSFAMMVATDKDKLKMAWIPGSDGKTPVGEIQYNIHLDSTDDFTPDQSNLVKTVTGTSQTEVTGLTTGTLYYGKVVAVYTDSISDPSNQLSTKTYAFPVQVDSSVTLCSATDLNLGRHTTVDGITYTYPAGGTLPTIGCVLTSEDVNGGITLRMVDSVSTDGSTITVETSDYSLSGAIDRGAIFSDMKLFDVQNQTQGLPTRTNNIASARSATKPDGSLYSRIDWKNNLLSAEQTTYAYETDGLTVIPIGDNKSLMRLSEPTTNAVESSFTVTVAADFEPELITSAEWGGLIIKELNSAHVAAKGDLSLQAFAQYDFQAAGSVNKEFQLYKRTWTAVYLLGKIPVYQEITLTVDVQASASAQVEIKATANATLEESVELGAIYNGTTWTPYIIHNEADSFTAALDIVGSANGQIRLVPKIEVGFYKVSSASLSLEPFVDSSLRFEETTNNWNFLSAHPERLIQLTSFDASLGMEAYCAVSLGILGYNWELLPSTCVLGTYTDCLHHFDGYEIFSIPEFELSVTGSSGDQTHLELRATNGTNNQFNQESARWEVFPAGATIIPGSCSQSDSLISCTATFTPGPELVYTIFASGHGRLGEIGRQFKEITPDGTCDSGPETIQINGLTWQRCPPVGGDYWISASNYCRDLVLDGYSDWRLPTKDELKGLVMCSNAHPTPLPDWDPFLSYGENVLKATCCLELRNPPSDNRCNVNYVQPTISPAFVCPEEDFWTSTWTGDGDYGGLGYQMYNVSFSSGASKYGEDPRFQWTRCVR